MEIESALLEVFTSFAQGAQEMDGRSFVKCLRSSCLVDSVLKISDADLIFVRNKAKGSRKINFEEFQWCLVDVAEKRGIEEDQVVEAVLGGMAAMQDVTSTVSGVSGSGNFSACSTGPERFFYDKSTYTGTHKHGGPTVIGGGMEEGDVIRDSNLMNRDFEGVNSRKNRPLPVLLGGFLVQQEKGTVAVEAQGGGAVRARSNERAPDGRRHSGAGLPRGRSNERVPEATSPGRRRPMSPTSSGPERFFYDKSTYTGTHRHGGPSPTGNGLEKKGGYEDLSALVNRSVVQDDALHRRRRQMEAQALRQRVQCGPVRQ